MSLVKTINPATEEVIKEWAPHGEREIERALDTAVEAFHHWRKVDLTTRLECVKAFADGLKAGRLALAEIMTQEMGKPLKESLAEVDKCVDSCLFLRDHFPVWKTELERDAGDGYRVSFQPLGPVLGIMPWNFPLWQVVRFAIPALLCGNAILLKHASNTWGSAEFIYDFFRRAFPDGLYQNLRVDRHVVDRLIADRRVRAVSLTGSRGAGISVAAAAAKVLKKCVLELGGSDAYVILEDADLDLAAEVCAKGRLVNAGQSCVAAKRFIVTKKNAESFTQKFAAQMRSHGAGLGPLARKDLRDDLHEQVEKSVAAGARVIEGAEIPSGRGFYYPASVLAHVKPGQPAFDDELFGPVGAVIEALDEKQAISLANRSIYGLGAAVFSRDAQRAETIAREEIEAGMVFVNEFVRSDARAPFGGVKDSGLGRELGREGSFEFTNIKTVYRGQNA